MMLTLRHFWDSLRQRPEPSDVSSVVRATPVGAVISMANAAVICMAIWPEHGGPALALWALSTMAAALYVLKRSLRQSGYLRSEVSARASRRLRLFVTVQAAPWAILAVWMTLDADPAERAVALYACIGMTAGASFMLHRTLAAALHYLGPVLGAIVVSSLVVDPAGMWPAAVLAVIYGAFLTYFIHSFGVTARERDRYVGDLSRVVAELEMANDWISALAYADSVTGLPNRKAFTDRLRLETARAVEGGPQAAVLLLDLDRFKNVNDTHGHHVGDLLLLEVATRLKEVCSPVDTVARLGGDEFVVLAELTEDRDPAELGEKIIRALSVPVKLGELVIHTGSSVGCAVCPRDAEDGAELLQKADIALNRAKENGRGRFLEFTRQLRRSLDDANMVAEALRVALDRKEITVRYQPKIDLATGALAGAEALVRWRHPLLGEVPPDRFLAVAADRGMIRQLSDAVFDTVLRDIVVWRDTGTEIGKIAVNIHPVDLKSPEDLYDRLNRAADKGIGPDELMLEITEGCFVGRGADASLMVLDAIGERGFELSLDDFGTGHAALSHLRTLPVTEIKIDRSFIAGIEDARQDRAIVSATLAIARGMGLRSVAEGIETETQLQILRELGADMGQGHLWSRSLSVEQLRAFALERRAA